MPWGTITIKRSAGSRRRPMKSHHRLAAVINLSVVVQAADSPELRLAAAAALPCGQSCALRGWCTRVLRQVWQAKECTSTLARYCACQLVCVCRSLIAAFRWAGVISFSKPFLASLKVVSAKGPLEQGQRLRTDSLAAHLKSWRRDSKRTGCETRCTDGIHCSPFRPGRAFRFERAPSEDEVYFSAPPGPYAANAS
jgi:hypothetical protein